MVGGLSVASLGTGAVDLTRCPPEHQILPEALVPAGSFRFGHRLAAVAGDDAGFRERFLSFFRDCLEPPGGVAVQMPVRLDVQGANNGFAIAQISEHGDDVDPAVIEALIPDAQLVPMEGAPGEWHAYALRDDLKDAVLATRGGRLAISKRLPWQMLAAHYFLHHVLRLQPEMTFLHGASLVIGGRGVFIGGAKGAGKSTLALALAARGHGFLGDEVAAIETATGLMHPFRRAVSIREGPQSARVDEVLAGRRPRTETLPDGTTRMRVSLSEIFPGALVPGARLSDALLLCGSGPRPRVERCELSQRDLHLLGALPAMFAGRPAGAGALGLLRLFAQVRCYKVMVGGTPDKMADLIEQIAEGRWATASRKSPRASERFAE